MEESVALDSAKQTQFVKSVRGIKKLLKKKGTATKPVVVKTKKNVVKKTSKIRKRKEKGLVYLSHIPHGFYEHEMTEYFKQFGVVTNARVIKSKRTGNSKGHAFVEFKEPTVAEIVAETMNNYLMGKRLIKAVYIPPSKQKRKALRKNWNYQNNPVSQLRLTLKKKHNADKTDEEELAIARKMFSNLNKTKKKLSEMGIDYDFFKPVDIPVELIEDTEKKPIAVVQPKEEIKEESETEPLNAKKAVKSEPAVKDIKEMKGKQSKKTKSEIKAQPKKVQSEQTKTVVKTKKQQKEKEAKLDKIGVKALKDFIQVKDTDGDSDSSADFNSDEYEKMLEDDNDSLSEDESELEDKGKGNNKKINKTTKPTVPKKQNIIQNQQPKVNNKKVNNKKVQQPQKRKAVTKTTVAVKNAKFEKQNKNKALNKVIKKKK